MCSANIRKEEHAAKNVELGPLGCEERAHPITFT